MEGTIPRAPKGRRRHKKSKNAQVSQQLGNTSSASEVTGQGSLTLSPLSNQQPNIAQLSSQFIHQQSNLTQLSQSIESVQISSSTRRQLPPRAARPLFSNHLLDIQNIHTSATVNQEAVPRAPKGAPKGPRNPNGRPQRERSRTPNPTNPRTDWRSSVRDVRSPPSAESGGVPNPTPEYIAHSQGPITRLQSPQNLLVVIDLNGTLVFRPSKRNPTKFVKRPDAEIFLQRCLHNFTVVIWSSAKPDNVRHMCRTLGQQHLEKAVAVWGRDRFGLSAQDYNLRVQCYKRLTKLWEDPIISRSHPEYHLGRRWDQTNTVLIDDSLEKARSEPYNLVEVPEFVGDDQEQGGILRSVDEYLQELSMTLNVSSFIRERPFLSHPPSA